MAEYIEREALLERLRFKRNSENHPREKLIGLQSAIAQVYKFPTADVVKVRHGWWEILRSGRDCVCSMCGRYWIAVEDQYDFNYCPACGAKMDGKGEGE